MITVDFSDAPKKRALLNRLTKNKNQIYVIIVIIDFNIVIHEFVTIIPIVNVPDHDQEIWDSVDNYR